MRMDAGVGVIRGQGGGGGGGLLQKWTTLTRWPFITNDRCTSLQNWESAQGQIKKSLWIMKKKYIFLSCKLVNLISLKTILIPILYIFGSLQNYIVSPRYIYYFSIYLINFLSISFHLTIYLIYLCLFYISSSINLFPLHFSNSKYWGMYHL